MSPEGYVNPTSGNHGGNISAIYQLDKYMGYAQSPKLIVQFQLSNSISDINWIKKQGFNIVYLQLVPGIQHSECDVTPSTTSHLPTQD